MNLQEQFNKISQQYDSERHKLIPCLDDFYRIAVENLVFKTSAPRILDLGAGTGLLAQKVLERYPEAEMFLVDVSEKMLDVARERFAGMPKVQFMLADYTTIDWDGDYDALISSLSIHHLDDATKQTLYAKAYKYLKPGGYFINADQVLANNSYLEALYSRQWKAKVESSDLSQEAIAAAYGRVNLDIRTPLHTQLAWLEHCGFEHVDCLYKYYDFVVMYGEKAIAK